MPERDVRTGIGQVTVRKPRIRDRDPGAPGGAIRFTSAIPPNDPRRAKSVEELLPWLYPKGISGGDFSEALAALPGPDAPGLAASTITRLKAVWWDEYEAWPRRDPTAKAYVYTREQRCRVHKTGNVLNQMPKSARSKAKGHPHDIWMAETKVEAEKAFDFLVAARGAKYDKAVERLTRDIVRLLTFHNSPAEHWKHIRTTNPIESTFATVRLGTVKTKGCLGRKTALAMAFKLILSARRKWRKLDGSNQIAEVIKGVPFKDGIKQIKCDA